MLFGRSNGRFLSCSGVREWLTRRDCRRPMVRFGRRKADGRCDAVGCVLDRVRSRRLHAEPPDRRHGSVARPGRLCYWRAASAALPSGCCVPQHTLGSPRRARAPQAIYLLIAHHALLIAHHAPLRQCARIPTAAWKRRHVSCTLPMSERLENIREAAKAHCARWPNKLEGALCAHLPGTQITDMNLAHWHYTQVVSTLKLGSRASSLSHCGGRQAAAESQFESTSVTPVLRQPEYPGHCGRRRLLRLPACSAHHDHHVGRRRRAGLPVACQ